MASSLGDPRLLFTPPHSPQRSNNASNDFEVPGTPQDVDASDSGRDATRAKLAMYVSPPFLASQEKRQYQSITIDDSEPESEADEVVEIVGEHSIGKDRYIYARYADDLCRRKLVRDFKSSHPKLLKEYERRKEDGDLAAFDPSASYVHPRDRVRMVINIDKEKLRGRSAKAHSQPRKATRSDRSRSKRGTSVEDEDEDEPSLPESSDEDDDESDGYNGRVAKPRRKVVKHPTKKKPSRDLPFSPKKTRSATGSKVSRVVYDVDDSDEGAQSDRDTGVTERVTRSRAGAKRPVYVDEDEYAEQSSEPEEIEEKKPAKKKSRPKASRPAYGRVRAVADLTDFEDDPEPLRVHRHNCEKCHKEPAFRLLNKLFSRKNKGKSKVRSKKNDEFEISEDEQQSLEGLGGWVRCLKCCVAAHWRCLAATQRDEILKAAREKANALALPGKEPLKRVTLDAYETTEFVCGSCSKGGICLVCQEVAVTLESLPYAKTGGEIPQSEGVDEDQESRTADGHDAVILKDSTPNDETSEQLLFRCMSCKRLAHYNHLSVDGQSYLPVDEVARIYQEDQDWQCADCASYVYPLDKILAWRPFPANAVELPRDPSQPPNHKASLPREYLVKWMDRSYRRTEWVPHMWLLSTSAAKLKNFLTSGPKGALLDRPSSKGISSDTNETVLFEITEEVSRETSIDKDNLSTDALSPLPDAEKRIPLPWQTVDRVLDVLLWHPKKGSHKKHPRKRNGKQKRVVNVDEESDRISEDDLGDEIKAEYRFVFEKGEQPSDDHTETIDEWEYRTGRSLSMAEIDKAIWVFAKWEDLGYDEATWDSPPQRGSPGYAAFENAFDRLVASRQITVPKRGKNADSELRKGSKAWRSSVVGIPSGRKHDVGQDKNLSLMKFQEDGVNWLCKNWFDLQHCILADEMGLGKTVQVTTFIGLLVEKCQAFPALVVVPNSTITNWVREFSRWAPKVRVVPFFGETKSREVTTKYELRHDHQEPGTTGDKFHVLITTYETVTNTKDFGPVLKHTPRWEVLVVDEGQRLKNDASLLFKRLNELNTIHRIIMTGTPLNNNIRELFNLMNFLDPAEWNNLEALEVQYDKEVLDEDRVKELHERLRPYFLRRVKADVLTLPPKNEVIVPLSMAPLQKEVYKSILSNNINVLRSLTQASSSGLNKAAAKASTLNNMLMQLRKCLQHPYLISDDIEPKGLTDAEAHAKLIDGSTKLRFLKMLLPQLKQRGHRVLLFSQFVIGLNIIEDFLQGEGYKFLRLDGNTKQATRQAGMDEFNREGSEVFIYLLSTRAGGVGINLWSADTVIIFDPDFNPHQDLQAIARAHRYGQTKTCLVFKFMVKNSAEERIMQNGKQKLVLDHLIVQKMDDEDGSEDVRSILTFGAKMLFEEDDQKHDIVYSETDVQKLIEKTEVEGDKQEDTEGKSSFSFAKVWLSDKDTLEDLEEKEVPGDQTDSWAQTLAKIAEDSTQVLVQELYGRGVRRKATRIQYFDDSPEKAATKGKKRSVSKSSDASDLDYGGQAMSIVQSDDDDDVSMNGDRDVFAEASELTKKESHKHPSDLSSPFVNKATAKNSKHSSNGVFPSVGSDKTNGDGTNSHLCGLCFTAHGDLSCSMTESSEHLAEYRAMLMLHTEDEPLEDRLAAIAAIDETLLKRGHMHLIQGQPLNPPEIQTMAIGTSSKLKQQLSGKAPNFRVNGTSRISGPSNGRNSTPPFASIFQKSEKFRSTSGEGGSSQNSLKRSSPDVMASDLPKLKKAKNGGRCPICKQSPHHLVVACPIVQAGPKSVLKAISRMQNEGGRDDTVSILKNILRAQKKMESEGTEGSTSVPSNVKQ
ncbi:hypothetical protein BD410DRAFT_739739 [Rickenella mellea]|uniref:Chromatin remodeling factor mit1 n=1 Tax=Rickenella mellea TaxID=50990 RepID=A0A4Y7QMW8_9AGAM|nr:hypothetical protein BD410DRAFT_739739 [Rickenella mellea]